MPVFACSWRLACCLGLLYAALCLASYAHVRAVSSRCRLPSFSNVWHPKLASHAPILPQPLPCRSYRAHEEFVLQEVEVSVVLDVKEEPANKV